MDAATTYCRLCGECHYLGQAHTCSPPDRRYRNEELHSLEQRLVTAILMADAALTDGEDVDRARANVRRLVRLMGLTADDRLWHTIQTTADKPSTPWTEID